MNLSTGWILLVWLLPATPSLAADTWYKYENQYFEVLSNAKEKKARKLINELEHFRASVVQVSNIRIPETALKTQVLILKNTKQYKKVAPKNSAGYAMNDPGNSQTMIVMPASGLVGSAKDVIRHEYTHAVLNYSSFEYPRWYSEGFCELMSTTTLSKDLSTFRLGEALPRAKTNRWPLYDWDELVSDDFKPHKIKDPDEGSSAYSQAWILTHYFTLADMGANMPKLQTYFDLIKAGEDSNKAFITAFGSSASELWKSDLKKYWKRTPYYDLKFDPNLLDTDFEMTPADPAEYEPVIEKLEELKETVWSS